MKNRKKLMILVMSLMVVLSAVSLSGCNFMAKNLGGTTKINLEPNRKLMMCTWKDDSLWYLTKEMTDKDVAESYRLDCDSNFGVFEGTVIINEVKEDK